MDSHPMRMNFIHVSTTDPCIYRPLHISVNMAKKKVDRGCFSMTDGHSQGTWDWLDGLSCASGQTSLCMPPPLSNDIKKRIVELRAEGHTLCTISDQLKVSVGCVHNTISIYNEYDKYSDPSCRRTGRPPILDDDDAVYLKAFLEANPSMYLDEIKSKLEKV